MSGDGLKGHCATCAAVERCRYTFGRYWNDKSRDGIGCRSPWDPATDGPSVNAAGTGVKPLETPAKAAQSAFGAPFATWRREGWIFPPRKRKPRPAKQKPDRRQGGLI